MGIDIKTSGIHHVALRVTDFERARRFYLEVLGFPVALEQPGLAIVLAGGAPVAIRGPAEKTSEADRFDPFRVGLDHLALRCDEERELERVAGALTKAGVWTTGVKLDETLGKKYVAFKDPDGIKWELYMN
jgi:catechol 2,3-dioxygenase-like lactoylglutathione lyase family enzyme